jgi:hypothetical protein
VSGEEGVANATDIIHWILAVSSSTPSDQQRRRTWFDRRTWFRNRNQVALLSLQRILGAKHARGGRRRKAGPANDNRDKTT